MIVTDQLRHEGCLEIVSQLRHASHILDAFESFDEEFVTDEELDMYINEASEKLEKLAMIVKERSKLYTEDVKE